MLAVLAVLAVLASWPTSGPNVSGAAHVAKRVDHL
jgi:hypothetical protein